MNNNNNNKNKSQKGAQKAAAQIANLANEVKQLRAQAKKGGGNAKPSRVRQRRQKGGAGNFGRNGNDTGTNMQVKWSFIEKDELISAVNGSILLTASKYAINPGLAETFPVGAPEAKRWTEWRAEYCEFYFQRTVSEFATQGQVGRVVLAIDYSALNDAPETLQAAELLHSAKGMPCTPRIGLRADPAILNKADPKYIRTMPVPPGSDVRLFDGGNLWFVTSGCTNATEIGELRVRYKFAVRLPNLDDTYVKIPSGFAYFNNSTNQALATGAEEPVLWDEVGVSSIDITNTSGVLSMPAGNFEISGVVTFNDTSAEVVQYGIRVKKDGADMDPPCAFDSELTGLANGQFAVPFVGYMSSDGTNDLQINVVAIGAAGTLTLVADKAKLMIKAI